MEQISHYGSIGVLFFFAGMKSSIGGRMLWQHIQPRLIQLQVLMNYNQLTLVCFLTCQ